MEFLPRKSLRIGLSYLAIAFLSATGSGSAIAQDKPTPVGVDEVKIQTVNQTMPLAGRLVARHAGVVAARISGPVGKILVDIGDRVEEGQTIATLVSERAQFNLVLARAEVTRAAAAIETARGQVKILDQELERLERLRKSAAFNQARYDDKALEATTARSSLAQAQATFESARAQKSLAELDLEYTNIKAPFAGAITQRHTDSGAYISAGQPVVSMVSQSSLEIEADVPADRVKGLTPDTAIAVTISGLGDFKAKVRAVVPDENQLTRTRAVRFLPEFDSAAMSLASNQSVIVHVPVGARDNVLSVHKDAVIVNKSNRIVYVVEGDSVVIRPVVLGEALGDRFEVIKGLNAGDKAVVRGNERLRPGQKVSFSS